MCEPAIGTDVQIQGLQSRGDLNGKRGRVVGHDASAGRVEVQIDGTGERVKIKPINAVSVDDWPMDSDDEQPRQPLPDLRHAINATNTAATNLVVGAQVELMGLQARCDLNGRTGIVTTTRWPQGDIEVQLDGSLGAERIQCHASNAKTVGAQPNLSAAVDLAAEHIKHQSRVAPGPPLPPPPPPAVRPPPPAQRPRSRSRSRDRDRDRDRDRNSDRTKQFPHQSRFSSDQQRISWFKAMNKGASDRPGGDSDYFPERVSAHVPHAPRTNVQAARSQWFSSEPKSYPAQYIAGEGGQEVPYTPVCSTPPSQRSAPPEIRQRPVIPDPMNPCKGAGKIPGKVTLADGRTEDRSKDWVCKCGERNFMKRYECHKCGAPRKKDQMDDCSSQEWFDLVKEWTGKRSRSRSKKKKGGKKKKKRRSSSSSSSSSRGARRKKRKGSNSSGSSAPRNGAAQMHQEVTAPKDSPEIEQAKHEALQRMLKLKEEPEETRNKQWRALLREWHPDKHENKEVATAVFQFLQKGKSLLTS